MFGASALLGSLGRDSEYGTNIGPSCAAGTRRSGNFCTPCVSPESVVDVWFGAAACCCEPGLDAEACAVRDGQLGRRGWCGGGHTPIINEMSNMG